MGAFDHFPYTNFHELNLMWILEALKEIQTTTEQFVAINSLKYADPIQWNIVQQYEKNTIVIDPLTGTAYISVQAVPSGVSLSNEDYWTVVFDLGSFVVRAAKNFTSRYEDETTLTATFNSTAGDWIVWGDTLYKANVNITAGDSYVVGANIKQITIEEVKNEIYDTIGDLDDLSTTDKTNIVAAINEVADQVLGKIGDLDNLDTVVKTNLVAAINEVLDRCHHIEYGITSFTDVVDPDTGLVNVNIPEYTLFWTPDHQLAYAVADIAIGDTLVDTVNYYPCTFNSLLMNIFTVNNLVVRGALRVDDGAEFTGDVLFNNNVTITEDLGVSGDVTITEDLGVSGDVTLSGTGVLSLPYHANVDDFLSKIQAFNHLLTSSPIYIFIGDSYDSYSDWVEKTGNALGLLSDQVVNLSQDSSNISSGGWLSFLTTWCTANPDLIERVVAVVCGGGINDSSDEWLPGLDGAISNLASYVRNTLPNATLYLAYFGWALGTSSIIGTRHWFNRSIAQMVYSRCGAYGAAYLSGMEGALHDKTLLSADGLHPNSAGGTRIAVYLSDAIKSGCCNVSQSPTNAVCDAPDPAATLSGYLQESMFNGFYYLRLQDLAVTGAVNQIIVGTGLDTNILMNMNLLYADHIPDVDCQITFVNGNDNTEVVVNGKLIFQANGYLQFRHSETITAFYASEIKPINISMVVPTIQT